jgi:hypothetical protein
MVCFSRRCWFKLSRHPVTRGFQRTLKPQIGNVHFLRVHYEDILGKLRVALQAREQGIVVMHIDQVMDQESSSAESSGSEAMAVYCRAVQRGMV